MVGARRRDAHARLRAHAGRSALSSPRTPVGRCAGRGSSCSGSATIPLQWRSTSPSSSRPTTFAASTPSSSTRTRRGGSGAPSRSGPGAPESSWAATAGCPRPTLSAAFVAGVTAEGTDVVDLGLATDRPRLLRLGPAERARGDVHRQPQPPAVQRAEALPAGGRARRRGDRAAGRPRSGREHERRRAVAARAGRAARPAPRTTSSTCCRSRPGRLRAAHRRDRRGERHGRPGGPAGCSSASPPRLVPLYMDLDGTFPNHPADPMQPENQRDLQRAVLEHHADLGLAFDGDADRVFLVDESAAGRERVARDGARRRGRCCSGTRASKVVHNLICSWAVPEVIRENGGDPVRTRVGHSFIKQVMAETGAIFGGEHSGHYYFRDHYRADSGLIAGVVALDELSQAGVPLSELLRAVPTATSTPVRSTRGRRTRPGEDRGDRRGFADGRQDRLDGLTVEFDDWWFNVRPSNTEPLLRLNVEARTQELLEEKTAEVLAIIRASEAAPPAARGRSRTTKTDRTGGGQGAAGDPGVSQLPGRRGLRQEADARVIVCRSAAALPRSRRHPGHADRRGQEASECSTTARRSPRSDAMAGLDPSGALAQAAGLGRQLRRGTATRGRRPACPSGDGVRAVVVCGMGGSGVAGDVLRGAVPRPGPGAGHRRRTRPMRSRSSAGTAHAGDGALVLGEHRGDAGGFDEAIALRLPGGGRERGRRARRARGRATASRTCRCPPTFQCRAWRWATCRSALLGALESMGIVPPARGEVDEAAALLDGLAEPHRSGRSPSAATCQAHRPPGSGTAARWCGGADGVGRGPGRALPDQVNENAKAPAFSAALSELDHNEIEGWSAGSGEGFAVVALRHSREHPACAATGSPRRSRRSRGRARMPGAARRGRTPPRDPLLARHAGRLRGDLPGAAAGCGPHAGARADDAQEAAGG